MAVAALLVSIVALGAAGASAFYTKSYADSDKSRRHDERSPVFEMTVASGPMLRLTLKSREDLDGVDFEMIPEESVPGATTIVGLGDPGAPAGRLGAFKVGIPAIVPIAEREKRRGGTAGIRLLCHKGKDSWVVAERVIVPPATRLLA